MSTTLAIFAVILLITLGITYWAARRTMTTSGFYAADGALTAAQNGLALAGDWASAAAFLGFSGLTALYGMDGGFYALGPLVAFCTVLFLIAEPMRNAGKYTIGDIVRGRMQTRTSLLAVIAGTVVVNFAYLMPQMAGAGVLVRLLTGISYDRAVVFVGASMIVYVAFGGMLATTWVQIVKAVLMLSAGAIILLMVLLVVHFDPLVLFSEAEKRYGAAYLLPGNYLKNPFDQISLGLGYVLGLAGLPHVMTRFFTVPDAKTARRSVVWVMFLAGAFFASTTLFGLAAADFVGQDAIRAADSGGNLTLPLLAQHLGGGKGSFGGDLMLGLVAAVATASILAVVSGLTLSTSTAIAHDFYANWIKRGQVDSRQEVWVARTVAVLIGALAIALGILAQGVNVAVLVILAICVAASANFPVLVLSLFWRRFNTGGVVGGMVLGLTSSVVLAMIGPAMRGTDALWPLVNPTIVSLPLGFLGGVLGTLVAGRDLANEKRFDAFLFQVHTGIEPESLDRRTIAKSRS
ncbi:cation acetate symporter [Bradyrhizobium sp. Tv2a-2]|uniref:solute symporter family protein n=1 Tax=Bradyrhizobium sp. Tv2a-2 TaxID=113395 RepID=UPI00041FB107|nr:cation acetate symporter [Bradyrhizobium sp. Tv2a-2]